jgi:hypothetical protein
MTALASYVAHAAATSDALAALQAQWTAPPAASLVFVFYGCGHDDALLHPQLRRWFPHAGLIGGSSSGGVLSQHGVSGAQAIGLLCLDDAEGDYGVAAGPLGPDAASDAEALLHQALARAGAPGEVPELVWIYQAPGREEQVLHGLRRVLGDRCPILGGSSADEDVSGQWRQLGPDGCHVDGLVVAVLFPSTPIGFAFQGGYEPSGPSGIVTQVDPQNPREVHSIDGEPAAQVYNRWIGGALAPRLAQGGSVLADTTMVPLATRAGQAAGVTQFRLVHPEAVTASGALRTFCALAPGERIYAMHGDRRRLIERAGRLVQQARGALPDAQAPLAGALLVYCGGCKLAVGEQIAEVGEAIAQALDVSPFLCCFTFGEQGQLMASNLHGNLMISALVFTR